MVSEKAGHGRVAPEEDGIKSLCAQLLDKREAILRAFVAEHGIPPSQIVQVEQRLPGGGMMWGVRQKTPSEIAAEALHAAAPATPAVVTRAALHDAAAVLVWVVDALATSSDGHIQATRDIAVRGLHRAQFALGRVEAMKGE